MICGAGGRAEISLNLVGLAVIGGLAERVYGSGRWVLFYLVGGLTGRRSAWRGVQSEPVFESAARDVLLRHAVDHRWERTDDGCPRLVIPIPCPGGYEVSAVARGDGVYVAAEGWHDMACSHGAELPATEVVSQSLGFVRTLLCPDAELEVEEAGGKPFRWTLRYKTEEGGAGSTTGLLLFNYFGRRSSVVRRNTILPRRY